METKFEVGKTFYGRSISDFECIFKITVTKRTTKTIATSCGKTLRVKEYCGVEYVMPDGVYSFAPRINADKVW